MESICRNLNVKRLDHHFGLALVGDQKAALAENSAHGVNNLVEAAGGALLLREADDAEVAAAAMLDDGHDLGRERDLLDAEICSKHTRVSITKFTSVV